MIELFLIIYTPRVVIFHIHSLCSHAFPLLLASGGTLRSKQNWLDVQCPPYSRSIFLARLVLSKASPLSIFLVSFLPVFFLWLVVLHFPTIPTS